MTVNLIKTDCKKDRLHKKLRTILVLLARFLRNLSRLLQTHHL